MRYRIDTYEVDVLSASVLLTLTIPDTPWNIIADWAEDDQDAKITRYIRESLRLVIDETAGVVFCSSMQKSNIMSAYAGYHNNEVCVEFEIPAGKTIEATDQFTIEFDWGEAASDLAKEDTLGDVASVLEYIEEGGLPSITAIAKQGDNPAATISAIQEKIGTPASGQPTDLFAAIAAGGSGGTAYPTVQMIQTTAAIDPNKVYIWGEVASLDISLNAGEQGVANVYFLEFYSGATATSLTLPASVTTIKGSILPNANTVVAIYNNTAYIA